MSQPFFLFVGFVVEARDLTPPLHLLALVGRSSRIWKPSLTGGVLGVPREQPRFSFLQGLHVAAVVLQDGSGSFQVPASRQLQREVDAVGFALLLQRGDSLAKRVCGLGVLTGSGDLPFQFLDSGVPLGQLRFEGCGVDADFGLLRFLLLLLRRLLLTAFLLLRLLRAILLAVHVVTFLPLRARKCARAIAVTSIVRLGHKLRFQAAEMRL